MDRQKKTTQNEDNVPHVFSPEMFSMLISNSDRNEK